MIKKVKFWFICFLSLMSVFSCQTNENKNALIGIWSIDSVYCNDEFSNGRFMSNLIIFEEDKIILPMSADENYMETFVYCKKNDWNLIYDDSVGYFFIFSNKCISQDTVLVRFINDRKIRQLRFQLKFSNVIYFGRKGLTQYPENEEYFQNLESLSRELDFSGVKAKKRDTSFVDRFIKPI